MIIIFGWNHVKTKVLATSERLFQCDNCDNQINLNFIRIQRWFELFFIPIFPYSSKYYAICPVCQQGLELEVNKDDLNNLESPNIIQDKNMKPENNPTR